jgi:glucan phosphoethanolaminetransferase (alkaline phosphatase superfamily)
MGSVRLLGLFALIPITVLLSISFFILLVLNTIKSEGLKILGYCLAVLLWVSAALVFSAGIYTISTGRNPMKCMMEEKMHTHMYEMMKEGRMPAMMQSQKQTMMKDKMPAMKQGEKPESTMKQ